MAYFRHEVSGDEVARRLGISRKTLYRWVSQGRMGYPFTAQAIADAPAIRPRGPKRNPLSRRYTIGRHSFSEKASG